MKIIFIPLFMAGVKTLIRLCKKSQENIALLYIRATIAEII